MVQCNHRDISGRGQDQPIHVGYNSIFLEAACTLITRILRYVFATFMNGKRTGQESRINGILESSRRVI